MTFVEHNNRKRANEFAEYITSPVLRQYLAFYSAQNQEEDL